MARKSDPAALCKFQATGQVVIASANLIAYMRKLAFCRICFVSFGIRRTLPDTV